MKPDKPTDAAKLRRQAEERLKIRRSEAGDQRSTQDTQRLLNELQVHQIELEMRNEELQETRGEVEAALARYTDLYDFAPVGYFTLDRDGAIRQVNLTGTGLLGVERSRLLNRRFGLFVSEDSRPVFNTFLEKVFAGQGKEAYEITLLRERSQPFWAHLETRVSEDGQECRAVVTDVTERKQGEEALITSEARYHRLFEAARDGILILDAESGMVVDVNPFLVEMLCYSREQFLEKAIWDLGFFKDIAANKSHFAELQQKEFIQYEDVPLETAKGRLINVEFVSHVYQVDHHKVIQCNIRDITERKRAEERLKKAMADLERSNKDLEQFAFVTSHDLQEPLRMVSSYTQLLAKRYEDRLDEDANDFIRYAVDGANRMQALIQDLLSYSRITSSGRPFIRLDLHKALGEAVANLQTMIIDTGAMVTNDDLPTVKADRIQLVQVFQNLVWNAIKFRKEEPPRVHIWGEREGSEWIISVQDNGIGIDPQYFDRLFVIFKRLHGRQEYPGTGIGLALCKQIITRHGGRIWVESAPGEGATFRFTMKA
jgi:chemotaxis family two-component system sensor kinase Cph1